MSMNENNQYKQPVVVVDCDGIVADFVFSETKLLRGIFGIPEYPKSNFEALTWGIDWLGFTKEDERVFWEAVRNAKTPFWENERELEPGIVSKFNALRDGFSWYWCTTRDDCKVSPAKRQTENFLKKNGFPYPTVIVASDKGAFCKAVQADLFIDDKFSNCKSVHEQCPKATIVFYCLPYQKEFEQEARNLGMKVVNQSSEIFEAILEQKYEVDMEVLEKVLDAE